MKLRLLLVVLATAFTTIAANAQGALYFNPVATRIGNSQKDTGPFAFLGTNTTSRMFYGVDFGGYYDFATLQKATVGIDVRDALVHGNSAALNSFMVGIRVAAKPTAYKLKPYAQISIGAGHSRPGTNPAHINRTEYDFYGGVDRPLSKHVELRIIEMSYGSVTTISSANYGSGLSEPASRLIGFSSGFVFRIP